MAEKRESKDKNKAKKKAKKNASYENMVYTKGKSAKAHKAPKGYEPEIVSASEELKRIMRETPLG